MKHGKSKNTVEEDLGIVVKPNEQIAWEDIRDNAEAQVKETEKVLMLQRAVLQMSKDKIKALEKKSI